MNEIQLPTPDQIKAAARAKGLSIAAVCRRADIDKTSFYRWQKGKVPSGRIIQRMIDAIAQSPNTASGER